jgi:hypothetical protein
MKNLQFELSNEQTQRLEELRETLSKALPAGMSNEMELPVAHYGCGYSCSFTCLGSCVNGCTMACQASCTVTCRGSCWGDCQGGFIVG